MNKGLSIPFVLVVSLLMFASLGWPQPHLPLEPDEETRLEEIYDHEVRLVIFLYSLKGTDEVDYVVGRNVWKHQRSVYGNPVYYLESYPLFYWWNHTMYNDPEQDGVMAMNACTRKKWISTPAATNHACSMVNPVRA